MSKVVGGVVQWLEDGRETKIGEKGASCGWVAARGAVDPYTVMV